MSPALPWAWRSLGKIKSANALVVQTPAARRGWRFRQCDCILIRGSQTFDLTMRALSEAKERIFLATGFILLLGSTNGTITASAGDWPQWLGPKRDGNSTETGLLTEWPAGGPKLAWKGTSLGNGFSSGSVVGGRVYTCGDREGASFAVALNESDGKVVWSAKLGKAGAPGWGGFEGTRSTPTVDEDLVFAVSQWGELACFDTRNGKEKWRKDYTKDFGGTRPEWGFAESPLVDRDKLVVTPGGADGAVVALEKKTGKLLWRSKEFTDVAHYSSLISEEIGGMPQYIQLTAQSVAGIAAGDGKLLWRADRKGATAVILTPIYSDGYVYVTSGYGIGCNLFKITK